MATKRKPKKPQPHSEAKQKHRERVLAFQEQQAQIATIRERAISQALSETLLETAWERGN